jgi:hypothetical protein
MACLWDGIEHHQGEVFPEHGGKEFTYHVQGSSVKPSTTNRLIPRTDFDRACRLNAIHTVREIKRLGVQGPSYAFAILTDPRISGGSVDINDPGLHDSLQEVAAGDSSEQRKAEAFIISQVGKKYGAALVKRRIKIASGACLEIDGVSLDGTVLCERGRIKGE